MLKPLSVSAPAVLADFEGPNKFQGVKSVHVTYHEITSDSEDIPDQPSDDGVDELHVNLDTTHIISSPYANPENWLNLQPLDMQNLLMAHALTQFKPTRADYATAPYMSSFNWAIVFGFLRAFCVQAGIEWKQHEFHLVIFRSQLRAGADRVRLGELDQKSHEEACASGGLLHYWFGSPNEEMRNLATCEPAELAVA